MTDDFLEATAPAATEICMSLSIMDVEARFYLTLLCLEAAVTLFLFGTLIAIDDVEWSCVASGRWKKWVRS